MESICMSRQTPCAGSSAWVLLWTILLVPSSGCATIACVQDWQFSYSNKYRASNAWVQHFSPSVRSTLSSDFKAGYKQGYYDTSMGKDCRLPPVAPSKYWAPKYQSCEGHLAVQQWFAGYQAGIDHAQCDGRYVGAQVPVSPTAVTLNKTTCESCYSPSPCQGIPFAHGLPTVDPNLQFKQGPDYAMPVMPESTLSVPGPTPAPPNPKNPTEPEAAVTEPSIPVRTNPKRDRSPIPVNAVPRGPRSPHEYSQYSPTFGIYQNNIGSQPVVPLTQPQDSLATVPGEFEFGIR